MISYSVTLERLCNQLPTLSFEDAGAALADLARDPAFLGAHLLPLLSSVPRSAEPYIAYSYGSQANSACLQVFVWPAGATTPIHDHTSWGAYHCLFGSLQEERYERLDSGARPNTAHLRKLWRRLWTSRDNASTLQPYAGGIHRVANPSSQPAISMHMYGPRLGLLDGRDYDPTRDFVCDRLELGNPLLALTPGPSPKRRGEMRLCSLSLRERVQSHIAAQFPEAHPPSWPPLLDW